MNIKRFVLAQQKAGTTVIAAASPGEKHKVIGAVFSMNSVGHFWFTGPVALTGKIFVLKSSHLIIPVNTDIPWLETDYDSPLSIVTASGAVSGVILYVTES